MLVEKATVVGKNKHLNAMPKRFIPPVQLDHRKGESLGTSEEGNRKPPMLLESYMGVAQN